MESTYEIAKVEFQSENDDGKGKLVYAYFGLAIYFGQCLEETFSIMLWTNRIFKNNAKTIEEVNMIIDGIDNSKKTMGNFINEVKNSFNLKDSIIEELDRILGVRNYLVHKYFKLNIEKCFSEIGQLEMIKYFCDFIDDSKEIDEQLEEYYAKYKMKLGITEKIVLQLLGEMKEAETKRALNFTANTDWNSEI